MKITKEEINYRTYLSWQKARALQKWGIKEKSKVLFKQGFAKIWKEVKDVVGKPKIIGCMGIRSGAEYFEFKQYLPKSTVYGVDIVDKVVKVGENCYCYDFNDLPDAWKGKFDLLFSNSLDHSFDVQETLEEWRRVTKKGGFILLHFSTASDISFTERYSFEIQDIPGLFANDKYEVIKVKDIQEEQAFYGLFRKK